MLDRSAAALLLCILFVVCTTLFAETDDARPKAAAEMGRLGHSFITFYATIRAFLRGEVK